MNVGVIGLGLIGGSIALKIKEIDSNTVVYGLDKDLNSMNYSLNKGIIDKKLDINLVVSLLFLERPLASEIIELSTLNPLFFNQIFNL